MKGVNDHAPESHDRQAKSENIEPQVQRYCARHSATYTLMKYHSLSKIALRRHWDRGVDIQHRLRLGYLSAWQIIDDVVERECKYRTEPNATFIQYRIKSTQFLRPGCQKGYVTCIRRGNWIACWQSILRDKRTVQTKHTKQLEVAYRGGPLTRKGQAEARVN